MNDISRRDFVAATLTGVAVSLTISGTLFGQTPPPPVADGIDISTLQEGFNLPTPNPKKIVLVKKGNIVYAITAVCSHQGGTLRPQGDALRCTKHSGTFDLEGNATKGPAKGQLTRYGVTLKDSKIYVDANKILLPGDFEQDGAFVKLP